MIRSLKRAWKRILGDEDSATSSPPMNSGQTATFRLLLRKLPVGVLSLRDGQWHFKYTDEFRQRKDLRPLVQFPLKEEAYTSEELWPFFGMRIPSLKQPSIQSTISREKIDQTDRVQLLRRFGKRTIANPYELIESE
jgi:HipA-like protein